MCLCDSCCCLLCFRSKGAGEGKLGWSRLGSEKGWEHRRTVGENHIDYMIFMLWKIIIIIVIICNNMYLLIV